MQSTEQDRGGRRAPGWIWPLLLVLLVVLPAALVLYFYWTTADVAPFEYRIG